MTKRDAISEFLAVAKAEAEAKKKASGSGAEAPRIRLIPFEDLKPGIEPEYLIHEIFPRRGLIVVWGPPKCGKSFWMMDAALHIALGWDYRGRLVHGGTIVYCAFEGQSGYGKRAEAFRKKKLQGHRGRVPFHLMPVPMNFGKDHGELIAAIRETLGDEKPVGVVLDTLNRSLGGSESKDEDMSAYIRAADAVREAFGCAVIIVHHSGIDASRPRGHTSLTGAVDAQIAITRDAAKNIIATIEWMKDGEDGGVIVSRLEVVEVGEIDGREEPMTSCVVWPADGEAIPAKAKATRLPKSVRLLHRIMTNLLPDVGTEQRPFADGPIVRAIDKELLRAEFYKQHPAEGDTEQQKQEARRQAFYRAIKDAQDEELIVVREIGDRQYVWFAKSK